MTLNTSQTNPTGTIKSTSVRTHAWGADKLVTTRQYTAQGAASTSVIREAHDIVRGNLNRGIDDPLFSGAPLRHYRCQDCEQSATDD